MLTGAWPESDPPDNITIADFMSSDKYGRYPIAKSRNPFTCGLSGKTFTITEWIERREDLARAIAKRMGWHPNEETSWEKVAGMFSFNTVSFPLSSAEARRRR